MSESLEKFTNIAKEDQQRAKTLFFSEAFKEEFLKDKQKEKQLYHQLLLGRNRDQILEEFLLSAGQKSPVLLDVTKTMYHATITNLDEPLEITVRKDGWGYIAGRIKTEGKFITLHKDTFHAEDFEDGQMTIYADLKTIPRDGDKDHLILQTVYQTIEIEVTYKEEKSERKKEEEFRQKKLYELYIDFCSGRISLEQFTERARTVLDKMPDHPVRNRIYDLMKLHLDILCGKEDLKERIPEDAKKESLKICQGYVWYLQAFYDKEEDTILKSKEEIQILYDECEDMRIKGYLFWFLMNLSEELMKDPALKMKQIKELYQEGCQNPLLRFEGCCILGEDEQLLTYIDSYELWVLELGAQEKILNTRLIGKICFLVSRNKIFSEEILWLFMCIYKEYPQTDVLQAICALMIQGNCMDEDCHPYYEEALQRGVQLIGLQEAFLRTIPKGEYPLLPEEILMYFTYSTSLGAEEQSRLFANVVHNRRNYHKIFPNYEELIRTIMAGNWEQDNDVEKAEQGIIFIDEIDKIAKKKNTNQRDVSGESVQQGMLKLLEGANVEVPVGANSKNAMVPLATVNTRNILFICGGAFPGLEDIIKERLNKQASIGFRADLKDKYDNDPDILEKVTLEDIRNFGMIPEFIGRLPIVFTLRGLTKEMLVKILKEPKNAILKQYQKLLALDEVQLVFEDGALEAIAEKALEKKTGARALRAIIEDFMLDIMYEIPKDDSIGKVTITRDYIEHKGGPLIEMRGVPALEE